MGLITLSSARGAPGVTTTALGLALAWPRDVLVVEADTAASSAILAGYFGGQRPNDRGILDLAIGHRHGTLSQALTDARIPLTGADHAHIIAGLSHPEQAAAMSDAWGAITDELKELNTSDLDVRVDVGRIGSAHSALPLVASADLSLLLTRTNLPAVAATVSRCPQLVELTSEHGPSTGSRGLLVIGDGQPFTGRQLADISGVPVVADVAFDPSNAVVLSDGQNPGKSWSGSALAASYRDAAAAIVAHIETARAGLDAPALATDPEVKRSLRSAIAGFNKRSTQKQEAAKI